MRSRCRRLKSTVGLGAIFIDYLQLVRPGVLARNVNRNEELSEICRTLKVDGQRSRACRSSRSRSSTARSKFAATSARCSPTCATSGSLEQEADVVAFLYRDGYYNPETPDPDLTEFIIAKHRNGPTGTVKLRFQREYTLFLPYGDDSPLPACPAASADSGGAVAARFPERVV